MPQELDLGFLLKQGYYKTEDTPLIYRALAAVHVHEIAKLFVEDNLAAIHQDSALVTEINSKISPLAKRRRRLKRLAKRK